MKKDEMVRSLQQLFVPALRKMGFKGSLPHFCRPMKERIDLLTIQFDKWGGGFVIEVSNCSPEGIETPWNEHIPPSRVRAWDVILQSAEGSALRSRGRTGLGSGSTVGAALTGLLGKPFPTFEKLTSGGKPPRRGGRVNERYA